MNVRTMLASFALLALLGCPREAAPVAPDLGKPPPVRSAMWSFAVHTNRIAERLESPAPLSPDELAKVKALVDDIAKIAAGLGADPAASKHPLVGKGLAELQRSLTLVQAGLAKDPPDLAPLRALPASCRGCHERARGSVPFDL